MLLTACGDRTTVPPKSRMILTSLTLAGYNLPKTLESCDRVSVCFRQVREANRLAYIVSRSGHKAAMLVLTG